MDHSLLQSVLQDAWDACAAAGECDLTDDGPLWDYMTFFLKNPEHTWGLDVKSTLQNVRSNYSNSAFAAVRAHADYQRLEASWARQYDWGVTQAMDRLPPQHPFAIRARDALAALEPRAVNTSGFVRLEEGVTTAAANGWTLTFDAATGALSQIQHGGEWITMLVSALSVYLSKAFFLLRL